jgi:hypothetical protein
VPTPGMRGLWKSQRRERTSSQVGPGQVLGDGRKRKGVQAQPQVVLHLRRQIGNVDHMPAVLGL